MTAEENKVLFSERQYFRQVWLWILLLALNGMFLYGIYQQIILGRQFGDHPMSDKGLIVFAIMMLGLTLNFAISFLETAITKDGIYYRFIFQKMKMIGWGSISKAYVREYKPLRVYSGWIYRQNFSTDLSVAYAISGNMGLQLVLNDGKKILIGTKKPEELKQALKTINEPKHNTI